MGKQHRHRQAADHRRREQRQAQQHRPHGAGGGDPYQLATAAVYAAIETIRTNDAVRTRQLIEILEAGPPVPDGHAVVARALTDITASQRSYALAHGWSAGDLEEVERRRLKVPAKASAVERAVRWLALLSTLPHLPTVEAPRARTPSADTGMLAKIRALLAKAESTTFPEEAESLSAKAQELMARHRIDRVLVEGPAAGDAPTGRRIWLDDPYADAKARLLAAVAGANRCRAVLLSGLGCTHLVSFDEDLDMTELLHTSLLVQATRAMAAAGPQTDRRGRSRTRSFRQSFLLAYGWRIGQRLQETTAATEAEVDVEQGGGLLPVLARRDAELDEFMAKAFPNTKSMRLSVGNAAGWAAGAAAAEVADLRAGSPEIR